MKVGGSRLFNPMEQGVNRAGIIPRSHLQPAGIHMRHVPSCYQMAAVTPALTFSKSFTVASEGPPLLPHWPRLHHMAKSKSSSFKRNRTAFIDLD